MQSVLYFGVINGSSHLMWSGEFVEMLPLPSDEYVSRQTSKLSGVRNKRGPRVSKDVPRSGWLNGKDSVVFIPWSMVDSVLCPGVRQKRHVDNLGDVPMHRQVEGQYALHHRDGWTALAWWDRSGRDGFWSNSALFAPGRLSADEMLALGRAQFPTVMERMKYEFTPGVFSDVVRVGVSEPIAVSLPMFESSFSIDSQAAMVAVDVDDDSSPSSDAARTAADFSW